MSQQLAWGTDESAKLQPGDFAFLLSYDGQDGKSGYVLCKTPDTAVNGQNPILTGWLGNINNTAWNACGLVRIVKVVENRSTRETRYLTLHVAPSKLAAALESLGYPELAPPVRVRNGRPPKVKRAA